jgi:hypothetical protein
MGCFFFFFKLFLFEEYNCIFKVISDENADLVHPLLFVLTLLFYFLSECNYIFTFIFVENGDEVLKLEWA